jgi:hypothetical protein
MSLRTQRVIGMLFVPLCLELCAHQYGDRYDLNNMPYQAVKSLMGNPAHAQAMAVKGNIDLFAGQAVQGSELDARGELTDASCYLGRGTHSYDHAFCAKACVAAGSPVLFLADGGKVYVVLTAKDAVPLPANVLDKLGVPGVEVRGKALNANGIMALAVESVE